MSLTQERINEIILKSFDEMKQFEYVSDRVILVTVNNVLSRIREEQKAVAWMNKDGNFVAQVNDGFFVVPLFTIPPAAPVINVKMEELLDGFGRSSGFLNVKRVDHEDDGSVTVVIPFPAAPQCDCKELVEALDEAYKQVKELCDCHNHPYPLASFDRYDKALANHKASMGEK